MATLWDRVVDGCHYEVRSAGDSRRLYTNGVLHSAYNPNHAVTGSVWDLILLPALYLPAGSIKRVLVLGAGAGTILHLFNRYIRPQSIIAVDIDAVHLHVAKRFFNVKYDNVELLHGDAVAWVENYRGEPFDLLIEDLFIEHEREPIRLMHEDVNWLRRLQSLVTSQGLLVINHGDVKEARFTRRHAPVHKRVYQFSQPLLQNRVFALSDNHFKTEVFEANLERAALQRSMFNYSLKRYPPAG